MRGAHGYPPVHAVVGIASMRYRWRMKTNRISRTLRWAALAILFSGFALWAANGARVGWTQTSLVTMQHDEITGIEYPVRQSAFLPGVEFPLLAIATALACIGWSVRRRALVTI